MEMRGAAGPDAWVRPIGHHFGIHHHLIVEPDQRDVGEFVKEMVTNRPGQAVPLFGVDSLGEGEVVFLKELVLKDMPRRLTGIGAADPLLYWPPRDDIGPETALGVFISEHVVEPLPADVLRLLLV